MKALRVLLICVAGVITSAAFAAPYVAFSSLQLSPDPATCNIGDEITAKGTVEYMYQKGFVPGWGVGGTRVSHDVHIDIDTRPTANDAWPDLPDLRGATGGYYIGYAEPFQELQGRSNPGMHGWSHNIGGPMRKTVEEPIMDRDSQDFEFKFNLPECYAFRIRATLDHCVGWNWMVTWYYRNWQIFPGPGAAGEKIVYLRCNRKRYVPVSDIVTFADSTGQATINGVVTDVQLGIPLKGATITATGAASGSAISDEQGHYVLNVNLGGTNAATAQANFQLQSPWSAVTIKLKATHPSWDPGPERVLTFRTRANRILVSGEALRPDGWGQKGTVVEAKALGRTKRYTTSCTGLYWITFTLEWPKGTAKARANLRLGQPHLTTPPDTPGPLPHGVTPDTTDDPFEKALIKRMENSPKWMQKVWDKMAYWNALTNDAMHKATGGPGTPNLDKYWKNRKTQKGRIMNGLKLVLDKGQGVLSPLPSQADIAQKVYENNFKKKKNQPPPQGTNWMQHVKDTWQATEAN